MKLGLESRVAVVTGASRGIGRAIALGLAAEGCQVAAVATSTEGAKATADACAMLGVKALPYAADVSSAAATKELAAAVTEAFGRTDILVNNAGVTKDGLFLRMSEEDWDRVLDVNLKGAFNTTKAFSRALLKSPAGRVINVSSVVGLGGNAGQANYAASKAGLIGFTKALAKEFGGRGVCVNAVAPGFIETDMTAELPGSARETMLGGISLGRPGTADDIARGVVFLASDAASYVTGQVLVIDGGMRI